MKHTFDILRAASVEELDQLRAIILSADKWSTDDSIRDEHFVNNYLRPDLTMYGSTLLNEVCEFGGNSIANFARSLFDELDLGAPDYDVIVKDVADKLDAEYQANSSVEEIEDAIIVKVLGDAWAKMSEAERNALISENNPSGKAWMVGGSQAAIRAAFMAGGFQSYQLLVIVVNAVVKQAVGVGLLSSGLSLATNAALTKFAATLAGPIGWAITGVITAIQIAGPSYKVTIPSVLYIAYLRRKQTAVHCSECDAIFIDGGNIKFCSECGTKLPPPPEYNSG